MNKWVKKSIDLANSRGYLDKIFEVYPIELGDIRGVSKELIIKFRKAFKNKNKKDLIRTLLKFPKFPIDDPYIASLRRHPHLLEKNPRTIKRIGERLLSIKINTILRLATKPKSPSRQLGNSFENWVHTIDYPFLEEEKFKSYSKIAFLKGSGVKLKQFAIRELEVKRLTRRPDFILKVKNKFIIGEAKFLTDYGGTQNNQFDGAVKMTKIRKPRAIGIAVLDGIVWFKSNAYMHRAVKKQRGIALSALLLRKFIEELRKI
ncbi:MAG: hypothetical protein ACOZAL_01730 [Patescibacteria group bacterium]